MRICTIVFALFLLFSFEGAFGQNYLALRRKNRTYKQFIPGHEISLTVRHGDYTRKISGHIDSIGDDVVFVDGEKAYVADVLKVRIARTDFNYYNGGINLMLASALLSVLLVTNDREPHENRPFYIASGVLFVGGVAMFTRAEKTFRINEKNKLIIIKPV